MSLPKILIAASLVLLGFAGAASATPIVVGDCSKLGGACASVCAEAVADCGGDALVCAGVSYQVPQCAETTIGLATGARAGPEPVKLYPCFNGGVTIVVYGRVVAECVLG